ncbi:MAG: SdrD B-like domain-containing protein, partial [Chloroflexia bacterium]
RIAAHFYVDQISPRAGTPSGYACLGFSGGDGQWLEGYASPEYFEVTSVMDYNLNRTGYCSGGVCRCGNAVNLLVDSPPASGTYETLDPACADWQWYNGWEMRVSKEAFAPLGFGIVVGNHHNSPTKMCHRSEPECKNRPGLALARSSIGDRVWYDLDGDGLQDAGEPGLPGVRVRLIDPRDGRTLESARTGADGEYLFSMLANEYYIVQVDESTLPAGFAPTNVEVSGSDYHTVYVNNVCGSDCIQRDGRTYERIFYINLDDNQDYRAADFGYRPPGAAIGDLVWSDADHDGVRDPGEPGIAGVLLELLDEAGNPLGRMATTSAGGWYLFSGLSAGTYRVRVALSNFEPGGPLEGYTSTFGPHSQPSPTPPIALMADETYLRADFGFYRDGLGTVGDTVWFDADNDGHQDAGEAGAANVTLDLFLDLDADGELDPGEPAIAQALTDVSGHYAFAGLPLEQHYLVHVSDRNGVLDGFEITTYDFELNRYNDPYPAYLTAALPTALDADFGYNRDGTIGDTVWFDADRDGVQDPGEIGVSDVRVNLTGADTRSTYTGADGTYLFTDLRAGNYSVSIAVPPGYFLSPATPSPHLCSLAGNESYLRADFGLYRDDLYRIGDTVFHDRNANGFQEPDEEGFAGVTLALFRDSDGDGNLDPTEPLLGTAVTDAEGRYTFYGVRDGAYFVVVTDRSGILDGYRQTAGLVPFPVMVNGTDRLDVDFGFVRAPGIGVIGDRVWYDSDGEGDQDITESGIANVLVSLYRDADNDGTFEPGVDPLVATTTSASDGTYRFEGLAAGAYFVRVDESNFAGGPLEGMYGTNEPDNLSGVILLGEGQAYLDADFGYRGNAYAIGDYLWSDADSDGIQDPGEPGIGGVLLELLDGNGNPTGQTRTTRADGFYLFSNLGAGSYMVRVAASNFLPGGPLYGYSVTFGPQSEGADTSRVVTFVNDNNPANDTLSDVDFGYNHPDLGSIGNLVWFDSDGDGGRDAGEPGLPNVTVDLVQDTNGNGSRDAGEPVIASCATDGNGNYGFVGLRLDDGDGDADYLVVVTDRHGVLAGTTKSSGIPHQNDQSQDNPYAVALSSGMPSVMHADFGYYGPPGAVGDRIWHDVDHDGRQDAEESGIQSVVVRLYLDVDGDGTIDPGVDNLLRPTTTDAYGRYLFTGLQLGHYIVQLPAANFGAGGVLEGFEATFQNGSGVPDDEDSDGDPVLHTAPVYLTSANRNDVTIDFGFYAPAPSYAIGNLVWVDLDNDGHWDVAEPGLDGVTLALHRDLDGDGILDPTDPILGRTVTAGGGIYLFTDLPNGRYIVRVTDERNLLSGYILTDGVDNVDNESQVNPYPVTVGGANVPYADFGFYDGGMPTPVRLIDFRAEGRAGEVWLTWETAMEIDNVGFNLYRREAGRGTFVRVNVALIPSQVPGGGSGALYTYVDRPVADGTAYEYLLADVDFNGMETFHGPVEAFIPYSVYVPRIAR